MITKEQEKQAKVFEREVYQLLVELKKDIGDDYRAYEDDDKPGMQVTISTNDFSKWSYQTGDNSFTGGCYGHRHWAVLSLYRSSNSRELAAEAIGELLELAAAEM